VCSSSRRTPERGFGERIHCTSSAFAKQFKQKGANEMLGKQLMIAVLFCSVGSSVAFALPEEAASLSKRAEARMAQIGDANAFLLEVNDNLKMALAGQYGAIDAESVNRLRASVAKVNSLLKDQQQASDLPPEQRIGLYNAQEEITSILRNDEKGRIVCQNVKAMGTRVRQRECLSIAQREARAKAAREQTSDHQRLSCVPYEGEAGIPATAVLCGRTGL
jgi:hypothetical protein